MKIISKHLIKWWDVFCLDYFLYHSEVDKDTIVVVKLNK